MRLPLVLSLLALGTFVVRAADLPSQRAAEEEALKTGMEQKLKEFTEKGRVLYAKA